MAELAEVPSGPVALAVNVYVLPFARPVTMHSWVGRVTVQLRPPGAATTLIVEVTDPGRVLGATVTPAEPSPAPGGT